MPCNVYVIRFTHVFANIGSVFGKSFLLIAHVSEVRVPVLDIKLYYLRFASFRYCKTRCKNLENLLLHLFWNGDYSHHWRIQNTRDVTRVNANYECRQYLSSRVSMRKVLRLPLERSIAQLILNATNIKIR